LGWIFSPFTFRNSGKKIRFSNLHFFFREDLEIENQISDIWHLGCSEFEMRAKVAGFAVAPSMQNSAAFWSYTTGVSTEEATNSSLR